MKKLTLTLLFSLSCLSVFTQSYLQNPNYGATVEERTANATLYSYFTTSYKLKDYPQAAKEMWLIIDKAPKASINTYIRGVDIYRSQYAKASDDDLRCKYLDTMMMIFDKRAEHFHNHPKLGNSYILAQKALTYSNYATLDNLQKQHQFFEDAIKSGGDNVTKLDSDIIGQYFSHITDAYQYDDITADQYISKYEILATILEPKTNEDAIKIKTIVESMFAQSGAASCENIEGIFKPKYLADPTNVEQMKKILSLFSRAQCDNSPFQMELLEKYYNIDPQPEIAIMLAGIYEEKKDFVKAQEYIKVAIQNENDPEKKVSFLLRASGQMLATEQYENALDYASQAIAIEPNDALARFFFANAIASGVATSCSAEERPYGYWLVYDAYAKALSLMKEGDPYFQSAKTAMGQSSANFPKKTDLFMMGLESGNVYTVRCGWVNGKTKIRGR